MAKGYWIAQVDIHDAEGYRAYVNANALAFAKFGARFLVRSGTAEQVEGHVRSRLVVLEFVDYATALACYRSPEYAQALAIREKTASSDVVIVEGYDGSRPSAS